MRAESGSPGRRWLRRAGLGGIGVATVLGGAWGAGTMLPEDHTATVSRTLPAPPARVWEAVTAVEEHPTWRDEVDEVHRLPDRGGLPAWRETGRHGPLTLEVTELDAPRRMVTRIADEDLPYGGRWIYELEPVAGGTRLTLTEEGTVHDPFFRLMARFVFGHSATMEAYLDGLERHLGPPPASTSDVPPRPPLTGAQA